MKNKKWMYFIILIYVLIQINILFSTAHAAVSSCTSSVTPNTVTLNTTENFAFSIDNTSSETITWIKITRPSENFSLDGYSASGWGIISFSLTDLTLSGGSLAPGASQAVNIRAVSGSSEATSLDWGVMVSDNSSGSGPTSCTGNLGTSISGQPPDTSTPEIIDITISDISSNSVKISWNTDEPTNSIIEYGTTEAYGLSKSDASYLSTNSMTINNLTANTTYNFIIKIEDSAGNQNDSGNNTFVTAAPGLTSEPITIEKITTKTLTPTPTPTPIPDTTKPYITVTTNFSKPFKVAPQVTGRTTDNKGVSKVEYSVDNGKNWLPVELSALNKTAISFSFVPDVKEDGNYDFIVRSTDSSGNIGVSKKQILVIDRLYPQVSGIIYSIGPFLLTPKENEILVSDNQSFKITLSDVGGATSIDVFVDDTKKLNSKKISLTKNFENNLWSGNLNIVKEGEYQLRFSAIDGAGNITNRNLNRVNVVKRGKVNANNAKITVHFFNNVTNEWKIWDGLAYGQKNPLKADKNGEYSLFLPAGRYYLEIEGYGFQTQTTEFFTLEKPQPINIDFSLKSLNLLLDLKIFKLYWPDFSTFTVPFKNNLSVIKVSENKLVGKELPFISIDTGFRSTSLTGKPSVLTFLNTWSPSSTEQVSVLNNFSKNKVFNSVTIIVGEKQSKVSVFQKRGGYDLKIFADPDAMLTDKFELNILPTHFFLDKRGVVKEIVSGVLSEQEIEEILNK